MESEGSNCKMSDTCVAAVWFLINSERSSRVRIRHSHPEVPPAAVGVMSSVWPALQTLRSRLVVFRPRDAVRSRNRRRTYSRLSDPSK